MIENDELVKRLTKGIGPELGKDIRLLYYLRKEAILRHSQNQDKIKQKRGMEFETFVWDLLAIATYYEKAVAPFYGASSMLSGSSTLQIKRLSMGSYVIDYDELDYIDHMLKTFYAIVMSYSIPIERLIFVDSRDFVLTAKEIFEGDIGNFDE